MTPEHKRIKAMLHARRVLREHSVARSIDMDFAAARGEDISGRKEYLDKVTETMEVMAEIVRENWS